MILILLHEKGRYSKRLQGNALQGTFVLCKSGVKERTLVNCNRLHTKNKKLMHSIAKLSCNTKRTKSLTNISNMNIRIPRIENMLGNLRLESLSSTLFGSQDHAIIKTICNRLTLQK